MKRIISKASVSRERVTGNATEIKVKEHNFRPQICARSNLILAENTKKVEMKGYQRLYKEAQQR